MGLHDAIVWTPEMDSLIGTGSDKSVGDKLGVREDRVRYRRRKLGIEPYRTSRAARETECANCGVKVVRKAAAFDRSKKLFCSTACANAGQKKRDTDMLRYGAGWKLRRAEIRERDRVCRSCGKSPEMNGSALHVHHLVPFRYSGTNRPENLVALCDSCHHSIEALTDKILESIRVDVSLEGSMLTVVVDGENRWQGSVHGADFQTVPGLTD